MANIQGYTVLGLTLVYGLTDKFDFTNLIAISIKNIKGLKLYAELKVNYNMWKDKHFMNALKKVTA